MMSAGRAERALIRGCPSGHTSMKGYEVSGVTASGSSAGLTGQPADNGHVGIAAFEVPEGDGGGAVDEGQLDVGMPFAQDGEGALQLMQQQRGRRRHRQPAREFLDAVGEEFTDLLEAVDQGLRELHQLLAMLGELRGLSRLPHQGCFEGILERADLLPDGGHGDAEASATALKLPLRASITRARNCRKRGSLK